MLPTIYPASPLDSNLAEQGVYNTYHLNIPRLNPNTGVMPPTNTGGPLPPSVQTVNTGGNLPPSLQTMGTGGQLPPQVVPHVMTTGGPLPASPGVGLPAHIPTLPNESGGVQVLPPGVVPQPAQAPPGNGTDINSILNQLWASQGGNQSLQNPALLANQYMSSLLSQDNPYIRSARQAGMETANARGLMNSSIAAGTAERAAVDASMPMFQQAMGLNQQREQNQFQGALSRTQLGMNLLGQREQNAFTGNQAALDRSFQGTQAQLDRDLKTKLQSDAVFQQDWLSNQDFTRQFNAALSMIPIQNASDFSKLIQQYAIENPEVYTPDMISGMTAFFSQNMAAIMQQYFPDLGG